MTTNKVMRRATTGIMQVIDRWNRRCTVSLLWLLSSIVFMTGAGFSPSCPVSVTKPSQFFALHARRKVTASIVQSPLAIQQSSHPRQLFSTLKKTKPYISLALSFSSTEGSMFPQTTNRTMVGTSSYDTVYDDRYNTYSVVTDGSSGAVVHTEITPQDKWIVALVLSGAALVMGALIVASGPGSWRYYLSGGLCAAISHTIPCPIDVVKTRKQVDPAYQNMSMWEATRELVNSEGLKSLLAGLGPTTFGYLLEGAIKFGFYEVLKPIVKRTLQSIANTSHVLAFFNTQLLSFMVCGAISGMAAAIVLSPMESLRIRMVAEPDFAPNGWIEGFHRLLKEEGAGFIFKGIKPMMYKQVPYTVTKNVAFDVIARRAYAFFRKNGFVVTSTIKFTVPLLAATSASIVSCIASQPGDLLLSLVNAHGCERRTRDIAREILQSDQGISGFFAGFKTRILHVGLIVTLQLLLYDMIKRFCGIAATGSA